MFEFGTLTAGVTPFAQVLCLVAGTLLLATVLHFLRQWHRSREVFRAQRESERHYRLLADHTDDFVTLYDAEWRGIYSSPAYGRKTGWTPEDLAASDWRTRMHPEDLPLIEQARTAAQAGRETVFEHRIRCRDGSWIWVEARTTALPGTPLQFLTTAHDITERRAAQLALIQLNAQLDQRVSERTADALALYSHAPCGYDSLRPDGVVLQMNDTELAWLGYSREEVEGRLQVTQLMTPSSAERFEKNYPDFVAGGTRASVEFELRRKDGTTFAVLVSSEAVRDAQGRFLLSRSTVLNINEHKRLENTLQNSEAKFRQLVEMAPLPLALLDAHGKAELLNERFSQVLGYTIADLPNLEAWWQKIYPDAPYRRQMQGQWAATTQPLQPGDGALPLPYESRLTCRDGSVRTSSPPPAAPSSCACRPPRNRRDSGACTWRWRTPAWGLRRRTSRTCSTRSSKPKPANTRAAPGWACRSAASLSA